MRGRIRHGGLTGLQVFLDQLWVEARLIDISEVGLQFAVAGSHRLGSLQGRTTRGLIHVGGSAGSPLEELPFDGHIRWTRQDQANERGFAGIQFLAPLELPHPLRFLNMEEE